VPWFDGVLLPPPLQPKREKDKEAINSTEQSARNERRQRLILFGVNARPKAAVRASPPAGSQGRPERWSGFSMAVEAAVVTVIVVEAGDPPDGVRLGGEKEQTAELGSVPQEKLTVPV
jgi:hypothetical protein